MYPVISVCQRNKQTYVIILNETQPVYLDCNATTPCRFPELPKLVMRFMVDEYGNAGSRTHDLGTRAQTRRPTST